MWNHGECSCCTDTRETIARLLKWARYACAPTYASNRAVFNPKYAMYVCSKSIYYAKWLNAISIAYKLFVSPLLLKSFCSLFFLDDLAQCLMLEPSMI